MKTSVLDGPSDQIQKFSKLYFCYDSKNLAEITYFNINTNFLNLVEICRENVFPCKLHKIFKWPSFHCQKFLDLRPLWKSRKLWVLLIFVMKMVVFFIRSLAKVVRKSSKWKNAFFGPIKSKSKLFKIWFLIWQEEFSRNYTFW